jgi:hypothetical protein
MERETGIHLGDGAEVRTAPEERTRRPISFLNVFSCFPSSPAISFSRATIASAFLPIALLQGEKRGIETGRSGVVGRPTSDQLGVGQVLDPGLVFHPERSVQHRHEVAADTARHGFRTDDRDSSGGSYRCTTSRRLNPRLALSLCPYSLDHAVRSFEWKAGTI